MRRDLTISVGRLPAPWRGPRPSVLTHFWHISSRARKARRERRVGRAVQQVVLKALRIESAWSLPKRTCEKMLTAHLTHTPR